MWESLFLSRWGGYIVMLAVLGVIVLLLRALFGPRGLWRDPYWDKRNQEIRAEEAAAREARLRAWRKKYGVPEPELTGGTKNAGSADTGGRRHEDSHDH